MNRRVLVRLVGLAVALVLFVGDAYMQPASGWRTLALTIMAVVAGAGAVIIYSRYRTPTRPQRLSKPDHP